MAVKPIPDGYHSVTPYLIIQGAAQARNRHAAVDHKVCWRPGMALPPVK